MMLNESLFEHTVTQYFVFLKVGGLGFLGVLKSHKSQNLSVGLGSLF